MVKQFNIEIEYSYDMKDILSVYYHMKILKSFGMPEEFEDNFNPKIMRSDMKPILEKVKENNEKASQPPTRDRYNTIDTLQENKRSTFY
jgi:hypothetical protein